MMSFSRTKTTSSSLLYCDLDYLLDLKSLYGLDTKLVVELVNNVLVASFSFVAFGPVYYASSIIFLLSLERKIQ